MSRRPAMPAGALALALCLAAAPALAQTVDDGWTAFDAGHYKKSLRIWLKLAEGGDAQAEYLVGYLYDDGIGAPHDLATAARWYRMAAEQGHTDAQYNLGLMYADGIGVPYDRVEAYLWFTLSADTTDYVNRHDSLSQADNVARAMTPDEIAQAKQLVVSWHAEHGISAKASASSDPGPDEPAADGTGFAVTTDGYVLTAYHVIDGCARVELVVGDERDRKPRIVATDPGLDLALLRTDHRFKHAASFRSQAIRLGEPVMVAGYPLRHVISTRFTVTTGIVSALAGVNDDSHEIQISAPVQPGNSGGPLLDGAGRVIGVVAAQADDWYVAQAVDSIPQTTNFAVRDSVVKSFLRTNRIDVALGGAETPLSTTEVATRARAISLVVECYDASQ